MKEKRERRRQRERLTGRQRGYVGRDSNGQTNVPTDSDRTGQADLKLL